MHCRPPPNWRENEIGSKLIDLMTAINFGLKHYVNEFIFVLCNEDGSLLPLSFILFFPSSLTSWQSIRSFA